MLADSRFDGWRFVWSFKHDVPVPDYTQLKRAETVVHGDAEYHRALMRAGYIIQNNRLPEYVMVREGQEYIQCWHGTPLKRLGADITTNAGDAANSASELAYRFHADAMKWTHYIAPSEFTAEHLASAFGLAEDEARRKVLLVGYPRNDRLVWAAKDPTAQESMRKKLGLPADRKVLLYAPTWRDTVHKQGVGYVLDCLPDFDMLQTALEGEWVILFRPHYYLAREFDFSAYEGFVYDASDIDDINDCYIASDALATDYSSVMFDYANLRRPILLYVPDLDRYANDIHGFYFDIREVPGPLCETTEELINAIADLFEYEKKFENCYKKYAGRFCPLDDGNAGRRVVETLAN